MAITRVIATALPYSIRSDAPFHVSVFFTHRLEAISRKTRLGQFPAAQDWVATLRSGHLLLVTDTAPDGIPVKIVSEPDERAWASVFPPQTLVRGFSIPQVLDRKWRSYPAHMMDTHALEAHLASALASPFVPPRATTDPVARAVLDKFSEVHPGVRALLSIESEQKRRKAEILERRLQEAAVTLGLYGNMPFPPFFGNQEKEDFYPSTPLEQVSPIEALLRSRDSDQGLTDYLDKLVEGQKPEDPVFAALRDVHAARRFYQRKQSPYRPYPLEGATPERPEEPEQDFHDLVAQVGDTPVLLRRLGLVVDVVATSQGGIDALRRASWIKVHFAPAPGVELRMYASPKMACRPRSGDLMAASSDSWVNGALPIGDPETFAVLDLDPDASALKLEQHMRDLANTLAAELNGDVTSAAPASLRSTGFSIARIDPEWELREQLQHAEDYPLHDEASGNEGPVLRYDDVVHGIRMEVWDDVSKAWRSLHERIVDVTAGGATVLQGVPDTGFLQLSSLVGDDDEAGDLYLHEVVAGWDGWSLSAPRPGKVIQDPSVPGDPVIDAPEGEASHIHITTRVAPGTLPRLRYGRSYSFRLRGVDLAGNSCPLPGPGISAHVGSLNGAIAQLERLRKLYRSREKTGLLGALRQDVLRRLPDEGDAVQLDLQAAARRGFSISPPEDAAEDHMPGITGIEEVDLILSHKLAEQDKGGFAGAFSERQEILASLASTVRESEQWQVWGDLKASPDTLAEIIDSFSPGIPHITTVPRPFLRWHPVPPPVLAARHELGVGETLARLVVREGKATERHVLPPKSTQLEAEQHGKFDKAIGSTDTSAHDKALAIALRERGTLLDQQIQSLESAEKQTPQKGKMRLASRPGANPKQAVTLADIANQRDTPLGEGQYVIHDTDELLLPYLPDPLAHGISLVFYDAGAPHAGLAPKILQNTILHFDGDWPEQEPIRLVVEGGKELAAHREGNKVRISLPAGEQVRLHISSALDEKGPPLLGLWCAHPAAAEAGEKRTLFLRAAASGWFWWLTPAEELRLVHAVSAPVRPPELDILLATPRIPNQTAALLVGIVDVHGPSTERLVVEAAWEEWVDDVAAPEPIRVQRSEVVLAAQVPINERFVLLWGVDAAPGDFARLPVTSCRTFHTFPDTRYRRVTYTPRGATRFAEFFEPEDLPSPQAPELAGASRELAIMSSACPDAPEVAEIAPLLLWEEEAEPDQPFALRRTRRSGVRVWLRRPWFSSGDGELLAVILAPLTGDAPQMCSRWAKDPVMLTESSLDPAVLALDTTKLPLVQAEDLIHIVGEGTEPRPARPVAAAVKMELVDDGGVARLYGYRPEFHSERNQWYVDIAMDSGVNLWPFVQLAVARYQPHSLPGHGLSSVVLTDWAQLLPERIATLSRRTADTVWVTITGPLGGAREAQPAMAVIAKSADAQLREAREIYATLQQAPGVGSGDLDWVQLARVRLPLVGLKDLRGTWSAEINLPPEVALGRPGMSQTLRVQIEEFEYFDADPVSPGEHQLAKASRLVYADHIPL